MRTYEITFEEFKYKTISTATIKAPNKARAIAYFQLQGFWVISCKPCDCINPLITL
jgi:hypothetical protein